MAKMVNLTIDGKSVSVPAGTLVVDAAKQIGNDIPVFCYHPKMEPVGMCRMCLVDIGRPVVDRATGEVVKEADGSPKIQFGPKLETACTLPVAEGMVVQTKTEKVTNARSEVLELLLTSHPLDCPVCDKGGECPLQNLTLAHGPSQSRFNFAEKMHLAKHVPLGDLIYLDRERCIQCGRCVRFQSEIAGEPVIGFYHRGRSIEISTCSEPGFDSIFSGNTTDICPVGALTTADFRFGARSWELKQTASVCTHCPVGCNLTLDMRREAAAGGKSVVKRVMPRQNEQVNEIWICDKGRLGYHFTESQQRIQQPLLRKNGELVPVSWDEALERVADEVRLAGANWTALAGGRLANEDLFNLRELARASGAKTLLHTPVGGGEWTARYGLPAGSNLSDLGAGAVIVTVATDLHEEAPVWWLRVKGAVKRGAQLVVVSARPTRLEKYAQHVLRCAYGAEETTLRGLLSGGVSPLAQATNLVVFYGADGLGVAGSAALAAAGADLLVKAGLAGQKNSGLVGVWTDANTQGAYELGWLPSTDLAADLSQARLVYAAAADPAGDDPRLAAALGQAGFVVAQDLFLTETAKLADVVLPALAFTEREGTFTTGERRAQRFYTAQMPGGEGPKADFAIFAMVGARLRLNLEGRAASLVFQRLAAASAAFAGATYPGLARVEPQTPAIGRADVYYGGTAYDNKHGLGQPLAATDLPAPKPTAAAALPTVVGGDLLLLPVTRLYDGGATLTDTRLLDARRAGATLTLPPALAAAHELVDGGRAELTLDGRAYLVQVRVDQHLPEGAALLPRSVGLPVSAPRCAAVRALATEDSRPLPAQGVEGAPVH